METIQYPAHPGPASLEIAAPPAVQDAISRLGRTEDVRFSPNNRRLAFACFERNSCLVFDIQVDRSLPKPVVRITDYLEIRSDSLVYPHGLDFIGENRLVVANRRGSVSLHEIPDHSPENRIHQADPIRELKRAAPGRRLKSPGSLCLVEARGNWAEILVCNNYAHRITRHIFSLKPGYCLPRNSIVLERGLQVPDGIAISPDKSWVAISNHVTHSVLIFDRRTKLKRSSVAVGTLSGVAFPHGIRFSSDGGSLFVADAGAPFVHRYDSDGKDWTGNRTPSKSITVLSEEEFLKGNVNPEEGGPKGIDLSASGDLLAVTCEEMPLAFFPLSGKKH